MVLNAIQIEYPVSELNGKMLEGKVLWLLVGEVDSRMDLLGCLPYKTSDFSV